MGRLTSKWSKFHHDFGIELQCINAERPVLTHLPNPRIPELKTRYTRLKRLAFSDETASQGKLPVHIILGAADLQRIKTTDPDTDPGAEFTMLGWIIAGKAMSSSTETEKSFFLYTSQEEFEQVCFQEVLGLSDVANKQGLFHDDYRNWEMEHIQQDYHGSRITLHCQQTRN